MSYKPLEQIIKENEEKKKRIEEERQQRDNGSLNKLSAFRQSKDGPDGEHGMQSGVYYVAKPLHRLEFGENMLLHTFDGSRTCLKICDKHIIDKNTGQAKECEICDFKGAKYSCKSKTYYLGIFWIYNLVGKTVTINGKECNLNPIRVVPIPHGQKKCNIQPLEKSAKRRRYMEELWLFKRVAGEGWMIPEELIPEGEDLESNDVIQLLNNPREGFTLEVNDKAKKIMLASRDEIFKLILSALGVTLEDLGIGEEADEVNEEEINLAAVLNSSDKNKTVLDESVADEFDEDSEDLLDSIL